MTDPMLQLARFISSTRFHDLDSSVVDYAKLHILDTIGVILAGSSAVGIPEVVRLAIKWGGAPKSTIPVYGDSVPPPSAAFAIGPMARALDYGGVHGAANEHTTEYSLPTALPLAESLRSSGQELITSVALGNEVIARVGASVHTITPVGIAATHSVFRIWGPVASATSLLGLDTDATMNAIGLAFTQGGCDAQEFIDLVLKCRVQHGFVCSTAIQCAYLAESGITGTENVLDGKKGMYSAFFPNHDESWITNGLDEGQFFAVNTRIKAYPSCTYTHSAIEAALACRTASAIDPLDIVQIHVGVNTPTFEQVCEPTEVKFHPRTPVDAQFSLPYTVATALATGSVEIGDFTEAAIARPEVLGLLRMIDAHLDQEIENDDPVGFAGARVQVRTRDGRTHEKRIDHVKGTPENPFTFDQALDKFHKCVACAARKPPAGAIEEIVEMARDLEQLDDVSRLSRALAFK